MTAEARSIKSRLSCVVTVTLCLLITIAALFIVPRFADVFEDFDTDMPYLTVFIINTRFIAAVVFALLAVGLIAKEVVFKSNRSVTQSINIAFLILTGFVLAACSYGLVYPLFGMMESLD